MEYSVFLEIVFVAEDFVHDGRDEVEDPLQEALEAAGLGCVTGGGGGSGKSIIDVEVADLERGLDLIRSVLRGLSVARSTVINQYEPARAVHPVYSPESLK